MRSFVFFIFNRGSYIGIWGFKYVYLDFIKWFFSFDYSIFLFVLLDLILRDFIWCKSCAFFVGEIKSCVCGGGFVNIY